jgi:hypothetical protein
MTENYEHETSHPTLFLATEDFVNNVYMYLSCTHLAYHELGSS